MSRQAQHAKSCLCKACSAARLAKPTPDDPAQGDIFAAVKTPPARSSLLESAHELRVTGQLRKEEALTAHDQRRRGTLLWLRRQLATLYELRKAGAQGETYRLKPYVTADDAEMFLRANPDKNPGGGGSWKGAIFRGAEWQFTGELIPSVIAENNGRGQRAWRYVGP